VGGEQAAVGGQIGGWNSRVVYRGEPEPRALAGRALQTPLGLLGSFSGDVARDERLRAIDQDSGEDAASRRIGRRAVDIGDLERLAVHPGRMTVDARQVDRVLRGGFGNQIRVGELARGPSRLVPAPAANPLAGLAIERRAANHLRGFQWRLDGAQIENLQALAQAAHVPVRVDQTGDDGRAVRVDAPRRRAQIRRDIVADSEDLSVLHGDRGGDGRVRIERVNARAGDRHVRGRRRH
jgi:hypothetical protein